MKMHYTASKHLMEGSLASNYFLSYKALINTLMIHFNLILITSKNTAIFIQFFFSFKLIICFMEETPGFF